MKQFTTILIVLLFSGVLSAQNSKSTFTENSSYLVEDASNTLLTLNYTSVSDKQIAELAGSDKEGMKSFESESFSSISKKEAVNQQNKIYDLKEKMTVSEKKQKISYCNTGSCDIETSNTGFWVFISAVAFAFSALISK